MNILHTVIRWLTLPRRQRDGLKKVLDKLTPAEKTQIVIGITSLIPQVVKDPVASSAIQSVVATTLAANGLK